MLCSYILRYRSSYLRILCYGTTNYRHLMMWKGRGAFRSFFLSWKTKLETANVPKLSYQVNSTRKRLKGDETEMASHGPQQVHCMLSRSIQLKIATFCCSKSHSFSNCDKPMTVVKKKNQLERWCKKCHRAKGCHSAKSLQCSSYGEIHYTLLCDCNLGRSDDIHLVLRSFNWCKSRKHSV